jgi:hypothetical protein
MTVGCLKIESEICAKAVIAERRIAIYSPMLQDCRKPMRNAPQWRPRT